MAASYFKATCSNTAVVDSDLNEGIDHLSRQAAEMHGAMHPLDVQETSANPGKGVPRQSGHKKIVIVDGTGAAVKRIEEVIKKIPCIRYLRLIRELDREIAITAGLDTVIGDYVVIMCAETDRMDRIL